MKYASLLLVLSAASLPGCGPAEDATVPVAIEAAPASPASPPEAPAQTGEPVAGATTTPAPVAPAAKPSVARPVATETAPAADKSSTGVTGVSATDASQPDLAHGQQIYRQACAFCHDRGAAGAPKIGDAAAWGPRLALGMEALTASALRGKGAMPAKGGNPALADAEVRAAVDYLVAQTR